MAFCSYNNQPKVFSVAKMPAKDIQGRYGTELFRSRSSSEKFVCSRFIEECSNLHTRNCRTIFEGCNQYLMPQGKLYSWKRVLRSVSKESNPRSATTPSWTPTGSPFTGSGKPFSPLSLSRCLHPPFVTGAGYGRETADDRCKIRMT